MRTGKALVLNAHYFPVGISSYYSVLRNIAAGSQSALDVHYKKDEKGNPDFENIDYWNVVADIYDWMALPVRSYDRGLGSTSGVVRLPTVVICNNYKEVRNVRIKFPNKKNIWERDNNTCVYTGKKLTEKELSIDHVVPTSKGGGSTWENLVTCDRLLNSQKGSKSVKEAKLKLRYKPFRPNDSIFQFKSYNEQWHSFVANL
tara:strand:- start:1573 stop:2178 length:606 start_codon:yes stop_codon:yes gene_type:complete